MNKNEFKKDPTYQSVGKKKWEALGFIAGHTPATSRFDYGYGFKKFTFPEETKELEVFMKLFEKCLPVGRDDFEEHNYFSQKINQSQTKKVEIEEFFNTYGGSTIVYIKRPNGSYAFKGESYEYFIDLKNSLNKSKS